MNVKRFAIACVVVYLVNQVLGFLVHGLWLDPVYQAHAGVFRTPEEIQGLYWVMLVTSAVFTVGFCYIFVRGYENRGVMEGIRYGALIGIFFSVPQAYDSYAVYPIQYALALKWFLSGVAMCIVYGIVVALIYREPQTA